MKIHEKKVMLRVLTRIVEAARGDFSVDVNLLLLRVGYYFFGIITTKFTRLFHIQYAVASVTCELDAGDYPVGLSTHAFILICVPNLVRV